MEWHRHSLVSFRLCGVSPSPSPTLPLFLTHDATHILGLPRQEDGLWWMQRRSAGSETSSNNSAWWKESFRASATRTFPEKATREAPRSFASGVGSLFEDGPKHPFESQLPSSAPNLGGWQDSFCSHFAKSRGAISSRGRKAKWDQDYVLDLDKLYTCMIEVMGKSYTEASQSTVNSAMRAFEAFVKQLGDKRTPVFKTPKFLGDLEASIWNEITILLFASWLYDLTYAASSVATYASLVKSNIGFQVGWKLTSKEAETRLPRFLRGIKRIKGKGRRRRIGWRAQYHRSLFEAMSCGPDDVDGWTQLALLSCQREGLLRPIEAVAESRHKV